MKIPRDKAMTQPPAHKMIGARAVVGLRDLGAGCLVRLHGGAAVMVKQGAPPAPLPRQR